MIHYNFYIQGPDDSEPEEITGGNESEFDDLLSRSTMDDVCTMRDPLNTSVVRCERGWQES